MPSFTTAAVSGPLWIALIGLVGAVVGSVLTTIFAPWIKWEIEKQRQAAANKREEKERRRALVATWRRLLAGAVTAYSPGRNVLRWLALHEDYHSLERHLGERTRQLLTNDNVLVLEGEIPAPLSAMRADIDRIEEEWGLV